MMKHMYAVCELRLPGGSGPENERGIERDNEQRRAASLRSHPVREADRWCNGNLRGNKVVGHVADLCYWSRGSRVIAAVCAIGALVVMCVLASMR